MVNYFGNDVLEYYMDTCSYSIRCNPGTGVPCHCRPVHWCMSSPVVLDDVSITSQVFTSQMMWFLRKKFTAPQLQGGALHAITIVIRQPFDINRKRTKFLTFTLHDWLLLITCVTKNGSFYGETFFVINGKIDGVWRFIRDCQKVKLIRLYTTT